MKIVFQANTKIRENLDHMDDSTVLGIVRQGQIVEVEALPVPGPNLRDSYNGETRTSDVWYRGENNWYYWGGWVKSVEKLGPRQDIDWNQLKYREQNMNWAIGDFNLAEQAWRKGIRGKDMNVAILDSGIAPRHFKQDLPENIILARKNFTDDQPSDIKDTVGHGTQCAGLIAARGNYDIFGMAPEANLIIGKILRRKGTNHKKVAEDLIAALEWLIGLDNPIHVLSLSISLDKGSLYEDQIKSLETLIRKLVDKKDTLIVAAVGNSSGFAEFYPALFQECLSAGGYDRNKRILADSTINPKLDLLVPGHDLLTTSGDVDQTIEITNRMSGSSSATALLSGLACLLRQMHPHLSAGEIREKILREAIDGEPIEGLPTSRLFNPLLLEINHM
ncbi:S8 family peptidase [Flavilitoribacter nigricans]|uniref:Peptidase S8/S53 domain-containing protein n=1 Tax=Flavilitoribacter nigricans (strain ATCC 23147 / DSM 23189 / NBRC 102662 / NCIMB 1420 / SS-2) TaxID=1122177 RepID=A0A2D0NC22_FLAN2|nr:S8 family serine peptidase [Flavilitoribacter nigricans]PHN05323.1 hypothetical protein CRP01_17560 [Flavilitoribacter nigricans DSM 23189 = NBRC 102662]